MSNTTGNKESFGRKPFQVLGIPFRKIKDSNYEFAVFKRKKEEYWQFIAGGGENNETPLDAIKRESLEEAGIPGESAFHPLDSTSSIPIFHFKGWRDWGKNLYVIPEYSFTVDCNGIEIKISCEHSQYKWVNYIEAMEMLKYDSNKTALWELNERLKNNTLFNREDFL